MIQSISFKKRLKGLVSLVLAALTVVAVFPPIMSQATASTATSLIRSVPDDYYYFMTGFDGSELNVGYLIETNEHYLGEGGFESYCNYASGSMTVDSFNNYVNQRFSGDYFNALTSVSLSRVSERYCQPYWCEGTGAIMNCGILTSGDYRLDYSYDDSVWETYYLCDYYTLNLTSISGLDISSANPFVRQMYQQIKDKANEIKLAAQGLNADGSVNATKTVYYNAPALNAEIIKALMNSNGVSLVVTYNFAGYEFTSTITSEKAKEMYNADITWYGPAYIAKYCGATWTGKTA